MINVNRVTLLGQATHQPETHATKDGNELPAIGLATNRVWKDATGESRREKEFHRLVCTGPLATFAARRVEKGTPLYVEGRLHTNHWEDREGIDHRRTEISVDRLVLLTTKKTGGADNVPTDA